VSIVVALLSAQAAFPQKSASPPTEDNLYFKALAASIVEMEKSWGHQDNSSLGFIDYHHMLVERDPAITESLSEQFGNYRVEYLETQDVIAKCKQLRKPISILKIFPAKNVGPTLKVTINQYWASYKKGRLELALSDWSEVELRYDCATESFAIPKVKLGGI